MNLLSIFHTGGLTLALTLVWLGLTGWFGYQAYKAHGSGGATQDLQNGTQYDNNKTPWLKIPQVKLAIIVTVLYVIVLCIVASDYKGV